ncbi:unnamed protein product [Mytilus edulis]|uniref:HAT C-terminal dimerisation domain-containing protein n=1 Tax=Mytilus edulis TaxID=6550 RepID=A0A8S3S7Y2_MYTED|nr:unnamed protein product [Mytilus edulis]
MAFTRGLSTKLQGRTLDIVAAYKSVSVVKEALNDVRKTIDERFSEWFAETEELAKTVAVEPSIPRRCVPTTQRENCPADTPEIYYRRVIGIPYHDDVLSGLEARFSCLTSTAIQVLKLVPAFEQSATFDEIKHFVDFYHTDLPSPSTMLSELRLWQKTRESMLSKPETVAGALKVCCKTDYPNISVILKIIATMGVTSCECERSNSELSLLKTYPRTTMGQSRLNGLALMHVHYSLELNIKQIIDNFARKHPRRMMLNDLINDSLLNK